MVKIKRALVTAAMGVIILGSTVLGMSCCYSPAYYKARARAASAIVNVTGQAGGQINQAVLDDAWKQALEIGGGNPKWALSVPLTRVIYVPSSLVLGPYQFWGITVTEPVFEDGKLVLVETIEIHLPKNMACHIKQVLIHELLHTVATRRSLVDHDFKKIIQANQNEEQWVRNIYPIVDMEICR